MGLLGAAMVTSVGAMAPSVAVAAPPSGRTPATEAEDSRPADDLPHPLEDKRRALREQAVSEVVSGDAKVETRNGSKVVNLGRTYGNGGFGHPGKNQYVELERKQTDRIFVILTEFGNERHPDFPDKDTTPQFAGPATFDGPLHNAIPEPDRTVDNSTIWQKDYSQEYYQKLYFGTGKNVESVKTYFETQSSGRYSVDGKVTDWVKVKYNEGRYGRSNDNPADANGDDPAVCASSNCQNVWALVRDAATQWVADQQAAGKTDAEIAADMKSFDQHDRYDFDGDGNFNESDGYIDHFQIVHSGGDQADGDPWQGEDAIWSHRWYAYVTDQGRTGPAGNLLGGTQIGNTGIWIGDYTVQPENGGLSVFVHEYAHDLGLPDDYDTSGLGDNNSEYWTLMAQSRLGAKGDQGIGTRPGDLGAWNKLQLGWLDYESVDAGKKKIVKLGPEEYNTEKKQALVVNLPDKKVTRDLGQPAAGAKQFFSGNADNLKNSLSKTVDLTGKSTASLTLKGRYAIEAEYDYLYFEASTDGGATWTKLDGTVAGAPFVKDGSGSPAISGTSDNAWVDIAVPLDAYAGKKIDLRLYYVTDGGVSEGGFFGDELTVTADGVAEVDGAESTSTWTLDGFSIVAATATDSFKHYYIAGYRSYTSYDKYLATGPYNFGWADTKPDWVEHYNYQTGLLISYWDTSQADNNTNVHPGEGLNLYIDAHPKPLMNPTGVPWRSRVQVYDAPFSLYPTDGMKLHLNGAESVIKPQLGDPIFNDKDKYFYEELPNHGVKLPALGVKIAVLTQVGTSMNVAVY
ncbi:immune inhibitor A domain-containing protein [Actinoplanes aureus]|uniref:Immune inhibitor A n=1 Tax=Actinoplanes aureus TaxID=2792083 RepID=A0A931CDM4_9ACTN|nr:immune inhibitor A domain-containing protein [Actinoplanes aureus]MBG0565253.1 immune inhibitor A [Actinoplanes aureus]